MLKEYEMIRIIADSTCNLTSEITEKYKILIAPLTITFNNKTFVDYQEISPDDFYKELPLLEKLPTTAAPSPGFFINMFEEDVKNGIKDFIVIMMSSGTSGTCQSAVIAKDTFFQSNKMQGVRIHVVDSKCMSHGSGYLVMKSAMMRDDGASFEEIVEFNETYKTRVKHFLSVGDLNNLLKSGRLSNTSAMIGKLLKIEPIMTMKKGKGAIVAKVRGHKKVLRYYVNEFIKRVDMDMTDFVLIGYSSDISYAKELEKLFIAATNFDGDIYIMQMGATVGTHVGLGGVSMYYIEKPKSSYSELYSEVKTKVKATVSEKIKNFKK